MAGIEPDARRDDRVILNAEVKLRRFGALPYNARVFDLSTHGCKVEFVERPAVEEHVWIRFPGLEAIESEVRWVEGFAVGVEFTKPLHDAVFQHILRGGRAAQ